MSEQAQTHAKTHAETHAHTHPTASSNSFPLNDPVDVVVIGTGAGGAPVIAKLAQAGCSVVALEAGKH